MKLSDELDHLAGLPASERPESGSFLASVLAEGPDPDQIRFRSAEVLRVVLGYGEADWPALDEWRRVLPRWFVEACAREPTREEAEAWLKWWRSLPPDEQERAEEERPWSLEAWLYWMVPSERSWYWWSARTEGTDRLRVTLEVSDWPTTIGALAWLLRTAGASKVIPD